MPSDVLFLILYDSAPFAWLCVHMRIVACLTEKWRNLTTVKFNFFEGDPYSLNVFCDLSVAEVT